MFLARLIGRHQLVAIQDVGDEGQPFSFRYELCPFYEGYRAKGEEASQSFEIPGFVFGVNSADLEAVALSQGCILLGGQVKIGIVKLLEVAFPP